MKKRKLKKRSNNSHWHLYDYGQGRQYLACADGRVPSGQRVSLSEDEIAELFIEE